MTNLIRIALLSFIFILASCGGGGSSTDEIPGTGGGGGGTTPNDTTPNAFSFADETDVALLTEVESNIITVSGIDSPTPISILNGEFSIDGGAFTNTSTTISNNQQIIIRQISSDQFSTTTDATITIGGVVDIFSLTTISEDTNPDPFVFVSSSNTPLNTLIESNSITISGINNSATISITGGEYSIDGGSYTNSNGTINTGQSLTVRHTSSAIFSTSTTTTLNVGGATGVFTSSTVAPDTIPDAFSFSAQTNIVPNTLVESNTITVSGIDSDAAISISAIAQAEYSIDGGTFTNAVGIVADGQQVKVRLRASTNFNTEEIADLTIGGVTNSFSVTSGAPVLDATPVAFNFIDQTNIPVSASRQSNPVTILGINTASPISIFGGEYSINGGLFTSSPGSVLNGQQIAVRQTSSANFSTTTNTVLTVGGVSDTFTVTTISEDLTPTAFSFIDQLDVALNTVTNSNLIVVNGINNTTSISIIGGEYSIDGGAFTSTAGTIDNGQSVLVRQTSSANPSTTTDATLTIGSVGDSFSVTTGTGDTTPNNFFFTNHANVLPSDLRTSNSIPISGINVPSPISIVGGEYSINGGTFTTAAGTILNNDQVTVRQTSSPAFATTTLTVLTIGGVNGTFSVLTRTEDITPNNFTFIDQAAVLRNSLIVSNTIQLIGFNNSVPISISGGEFSLDGGNFTAVATTVNSGQLVRVRQTSSANFSTTTDAVLTVGNVSDTFSVTTGGGDTAPNTFFFTNHANVPRSDLRTSNSIPIIGINVPSPISIVGGEYSINGGTFTSSAGTISNNDQVVLRQTSSPEFATNTLTVLTIGGVNGTFNVLTLSEDSTPNSFTFIDQIDVATNLPFVSNSVPIFGFNTSLPMSISGGEFSINGGSFTSVSTTVTSGQNVRIRLISSSNSATTTNATLTVGSVSDTFSVSTVGADITPDPFSLFNRVSISPSTLIISNTILISGVSSSTPISIVGGEYSINGGPFTSNPGVINSGQFTRVRQTSSANFTTTTDTILTIGDTSDTFSVTTADQDTTPFAFNFSNQNNALLNTLISSNFIAINGINSPTPISISGGEFSINNGPFSATPTTVNNSQLIRVRQTSSANFSTTTNLVLTVGGVSGTFSVTTAGIDTTPFQFSFTDQSNIQVDTLVSSNFVTIIGINAPTPVTIVGGEFSISGGAFTTSASTIDNLDNIVVRQTSSLNTETTTDTILTIGGISDTFSVTTITADTSPDAFLFTDQTDVAVNTLTTSNSIVLSGINTATAISIIGGEFSIDGGSFGSVADTINNGQSVVVRQFSSANDGTTTDTVLTVGDLSDTFSVTTLHPPGTTPDPFSFINQIDVPRDDLRTSDTITVTGISVTTPISISNGEYEIDGGGFTNLPSTILVGQQVTVRQTSASTFSSTTDAVLTVGSFSNAFSVTTLATHAVVINRELTITDLSVVESVHADPGGHWTFEHLITEMMPQANPTAQEKSDFVLSWLSHWASVQTVNGFNVPARSNMQFSVINPWIAASGGTGELDLSIAPFRLLAIVNRLDLAQRDSSGNVLNAGEGRLVFGVLNSSGFPMQFTVIFEYGLPATSEAELDQWITDWHALSLNNFSNTDPAFNDALLTVTDKFTSKNAAPLKPNGSALNQFRSNEIAIGSPWELREFTLSSLSNELEQVTVKENPDFNAINNSVLLRDFINQNEQAIIDRTISIPETFNGQDFLGGSAINFGGSGAIFRASGINNNEARHQLSLNTCSGCHGGETGTSFLHVFPRSQGQESNLSGFLKGSFNGLPLTVRDPVDFSTTREFFDLDGRRNNLECLLNGCSP